jgi:hypothetical protein
MQSYVQRWKDLEAKESDGTKRGKLETDDPRFSD